MKRVLLTGMSGTGKSSVIQALADRGYKAVDADYGWSERGPDGDWVWREDLIQELLSTAEGDVLFLSGCATNQGRFYPQFDHIILLTAPTGVIFERLARRTTNRYGKSAEELQEVRRHIETFEPLLRRTAHHVIDTTAPLNEVVESILQIVRVGSDTGGCSRMSPES